MRVNSYNVASLLPYDCNLYNVRFKLQIHLKIQELNLGGGGALDNIFCKISKKEKNFPKFSDKSGSLGGVVVGGFLN